MKYYILTSLCLLLSLFVVPSAKATQFCKFTSKYVGDGTAGTKETTVCKSVDFIKNNVPILKTTIDTGSANEICSEYYTYIKNNTSKDFELSDLGCLDYFSEGECRENINKIGACTLLEETTKLNFEFKAPTVTIKIPGLTFADLQKSVTKDIEGNKYVNIPWLGQYITSVYSFSIVIVSIVAVFMIIIQGLLVMTSGGGERKMAAYKKIGQVAIGLVIIWSSYLILYNINPDLVQFKALQVRIVEPIDVTYSISKTEGGEPLVKRPAKIVKTEAEQFADREAGHYGFNACMFKIQIRKESGWNTNSASKCCYGLGQIDLLNAQDYLKSSRNKLIKRHSTGCKSCPAADASKEQIANWLMDDYEANIMIAASLRASAGKQGNPIAAAAIYGMGAGSYNLYLKVKPCQPLEKYNSEAKVLQAIKTDTVDDLIKGSCIPPITWAIPGNKAKGIKGCPNYYHCCDPTKLPKECKQPPHTPSGRQGKCGGGTRAGQTCYAVAGAETYIRAFIKELKELKECAH